MKHFKIGQKIKSILTDNEEVNQYLSNKIFPIVANAGTELPFLIYRRFNYTPQSDKDYTNERAEFEIRIVAKKYEDSVIIADAVGSILNNYEDDEVEQISILSSSEDFLDEAFVQTLNVEILLK